MLDRWKRAVIHLECATDSEHFYDRIKKDKEQRQLLELGNITFEEYVQNTKSKSWDVRFHGTALFLTHGGRRYLLTARHVLWDELCAMREYSEALERIESGPGYHRERDLESAMWSRDSCVFTAVFRVPSLDEVLAGHDPASFLMNLGAGAPATKPYLFSEPHLDLAVVSLESRYAMFADELMAAGYAPMPSSDFALNGPNHEGEELFTIGFPGSTALLGQNPRLAADTHWASTHVSLPVSSFGRVSMLHDQLPFFWADLSIYPGNSGGPVIAGDQLVGVVSAQAVVPLDEMPDVLARVPFANVIKSKHVHDILEVQKRKDDYWDELMNPEPPPP